MEGENFDRMVFAEGSTESSRKEHLDRVLLTRLDRAVRVNRLSNEQKAKLHLAGVGDVKRFLDRAEAKRAEFEAVRKNFAEATRSLQQAESLAAEYRRGPFGDDSLFAKTLRTIRDGEAAKR